MEQSGEYRIAASRQAVWSALNDPDVLGRCIDGCESMEKLADDHFRARIKAKVGPVRATFDADLTLSDIDPPTSYTINAQVKGGPAGFARGAARVALADADAETLLRYQVDASIGGKLAQVGSRLIDGTARKMSEDFFTRFREEVQSASGAGPVGETALPQQASPDDRSSVDQAAPAAVADADEQNPAAPPAGAYESGGRWMIWLAAFVALLLALVLAF